MARIVVVEDLVGPSVAGRGGNALHVLQALEGLRRAGHDVFFCEFLTEAPNAATLAAFGALVADWWWPERAALLDAGTGDVLAGAPVAAFAAEADALVSLAAHYRAEPWPGLGDIRPRILVEQDPGYTHLWAADAEDPRTIFGAHDVHFTVGLNVGSDRCALPTSGLAWHPLPAPVVTDWWPVTPPPAGAAFSTVGAWRDYGYLEWEGAVVGPKAEEFERFIDLPARTGVPLELVLAIDPDDPDRPRLLERGWRLLDPEVVGTPAAFRDYVLRSAGEFSCAKGGYVATRSGWFSDRTACYLAAGRPAVVQSTGFEDVLPTGAGLFAVADAEEAAAAIAAVQADPGRHAAAATAVAREHLEAATVMAHMLRTAGVAG